MKDKRDLLKSIKYVKVNDDGAKKVHKVCKWLTVRVLVNFIKDIKYVNG